MVGGDDPPSIGFALDVARSAPHRFESANMAFGKAFARGRVMLQVRVDRVPPAIRCRHLGHRAIHATNAAPARPHLSAHVCRYRLTRFSLAHPRIIRTALVSPSHSQPTLHNSIQ